MSEQKLTRVNAMPAPTWYRLHMNDADIEIPAGLEPARTIEVEMEGALVDNANAMAEAMDAAQAAWDESHKDFEVLANYEDESALKLGGTALSRYQIEADEIEFSRKLASSFQQGMGDEATDYLREMAGDTIVIAAEAGKSATATVRINGVDARANVAMIDLVAPENSTVELVIAVDSPTAGTGLTGSTLRVFAGANARVKVTRIQSLDDSWTDLDDMGLFLDENAVIEVVQTVLGAGKTYTGLCGDLRGSASRADVITRYLGHGEQTLDFNYILRHHGPKTLCNLNANGVLAGNSDKTLRGTIDLIRGCKGAEGQETETVLLVDEGVSNKTVPTILCNEDDVAGNHGATIGHVRDEQLFYLASRGLSPEAAEGMFLSAMLEQAIIEAPDDKVREGVTRLGNQLIPNFEEVYA